MKKFILYFIPLMLLCVACEEKIEPITKYKKIINVNNEIEICEVKNPIENNASLNNLHKILSNKINDTELKETMHIFLYAYRNEATGSDSIVLHYHTATGDDILISGCDMIPVYKCEKWDGNMFDKQPYDTVVQSVKGIECDCNRFFRNNTRTDTIAEYHNIKYTYDPNINLWIFD